MKSLHSLIHGVLVISSSVFLSYGCAETTTEVTDGQGRIRIYLIDSPGSFEQVNIVVDRVEVHLAGTDTNSRWFVINSVRDTFDLLTLRNGAQAVLGDTVLAPGHYTQIRLFIGDGSNVVVAGTTHALEIPSDKLKFNHQFRIEPNTLYELTLDFDAHRSIHQTGNGRYKLKPVIRVHANVVSGTISGNVSPASANPVISTIAGPDTVSTLADSTSGAFKLLALPAGFYDVTITPSDTTYRDTTITGVQVIARQDTPLGTIALSLR